MEMIKEKVLRVDEIKKTNSSYGNYVFKVEVLRSGLNGLYKTKLDIFEFGLKKIQENRKGYLNRVLKNE